jgi:hypothetical protein
MRVPLVRDRGYVGATLVSLLQATERRVGGLNLVQREYHVQVRDATETVHRTGYGLSYDEFSPLRIARLHEMPRRLNRRFSIPRKRPSNGHCLTGAGA